MDRPDATPPLVAATGGRLFGERAVSAARRPARRFPGRGLAVAQRQQKSTIALAPYVAITALAPLALLLWRRHLSWVASGAAFERRLPTGLASDWRWWTRETGHRAPPRRLAAARQRV